MSKLLLKPDYIFESSWEVCNKVGGIYTVLSSRAKTLQNEMQDRVLFIGPDVWKENESPYFKEDKALFADWQWEAKEQGLTIRVGRWTVPGEPIAILVDFTPFFEKKLLKVSRNSLKILRAVTSLEARSEAGRGNAQV